MNDVKEFSSPIEVLDRFKQGEITNEEALTVIRAFPISMEIPRYCFEGQTHHEQISQESDEKYELEVPTHKNFEGRIYMGVKGATFPIKTMVDTKVLSSTNIAKSVLIEPIKLLTMPQFWLPVIITAISLKSLNKVIQSFNRVVNRVMSPYILRDEHCTVFTPQFCFLIFTILHQIGIKENEAFRFATLVSRMVEYDNAYRLRIEDIFSETSKDKWSNPAKEIKRLVKIFAERDINPEVIKKVNKLALLVRLFLLIPRNKEAIIYAMNQVELSELQLDDQDKFYLCMRKDYDGMGMTYEERKEWVKSKGWVFPTQL